MEEATQQGADTQIQATEDSDFARRIAAMESGEQLPDDGSNEAVNDSNIEDQANDATPETEQESTFKIKVDGEERELTKEQLIAEAQKGISANKRFEEAAQLRKQHEAQQQQIQQERTQLSQAVEHYSAQLQSLMQQGQPDWNALLEHNPIEYLKQKEIYSQYQTQLQQAQAAQAYLEQQRLTEEKQHKVEKIASEHRKMLDIIPEWRDQNKFNDGIREIDQFLSNQGVVIDNGAELFTAPMVKIFRDAMNYQKIMAKQDPALKRVEKLPPKVEKSGTGIRPTDGRNTQMQKLSKSGRAEDAAGLIANFL